MKAIKCKALELHRKSNVYVYAELLTFFLLSSIKVLKKNLSADALKFIIVEKKDEDKEVILC